jgi:uncharacterized lipoprotein YmbA
MNASNDRIALDMQSGRALKAPGSKVQAPDNIQAASFKLKLLSLLGVVICVGLTGCKSFRPVEDLTRYYVLSASSGAPAAGQSNQALNIGVAPIQTPGYLQSTRIAVRRGTNEISYSEYRQWAEHLDKGIQRVLASNLSTLLPSVRVITSAWQSSDVKAEVHVSIQRFELDESGVATLECEWRIVSPDGVRALRVEHALISKKGPPLANNPTGAVHTLSEALADLSNEIATALQDLSVSQMQSK